MIALLIVALLGAVAVGALLLREEDRFPARGGALSLGVGGWAELVVDTEGRIWSAYEGAVSMHDPATGATRAYSLADDITLTRARILGPASSGGIWIWERSAGTAQRFDGEQLAETLVLDEAHICSLADGQELLVLACDGSLWRRHDQEWILLAGGFPGWTAWQFAIDGGELLWVLGPHTEGEFDTGLWQYRHGEWVTVDHEELLGFASTGLLVTPDGTLWAHDGDVTGGLASWDGEFWRRYTSPETGLAFAYDMDVSPDGPLLALGNRLGF